MPYSSYRDRPCGLVPYVSPPSAGSPFGFGLRPLVSQPRAEIKVSGRQDPHVQVQQKRNWDASSMLSQGSSREEAPSSVDGLGFLQKSINHEGGKSVSRPYMPNRHLKCPDKSIAFRALKTSRRGGPGKDQNEAMHL